MLVSTKIGTCWNVMPLSLLDTYVTAFCRILVLYQTTWHLMPGDCIHEACHLHCE